MDKELSKRYQELNEALKGLFRELASLKLENERLSKENITLREEVSLLRLYIDTYQQEGEAAIEELEEMNLIPPISKDALEFYDSLPQSFNFPELFELADLLGVEKQRMKGFMTTYLRENMMEQHGTRVEKTDKYGNLWERSLGQFDEGEQEENVKRKS